MSTAMWKPVGPMSSAEFQTVDSDRLADIKHKHEAISRLLESRQLDALLLKRPFNFSWFTSGGDCSRGATADGSASPLITPEARVVVTSNADSAQLFDRELQGLGFQLKELPVAPASRHVDRRLVPRTCRRQRCRLQWHARPERAGESAAMPLSSVECRRLREFGPALADAIEATCRNCEAGQSESEIAGEVAHRLLRHQIQPERIQVCADGRAQTYPHWTYGPDAVKRYVVVTAVGRRDGLCVGASRTVCFGTPPESVANDHHRTILIQASGMFFSQANSTMVEIWSRVVRIYEKFNCDDFWERTEQAEVIGYEMAEYPFVPHSEFRIAPRMAVYWHPAVGTAVTGDTILVGDGEFEVLTPAEGWPKLKVVVKGTTIYRPDILVRKP